MFNNSKKLESIDVNAIVTFKYKNYDRVQISLSFSDIEHLIKWAEKLKVAKDGVLEETDYGREETN